jgi:hypothetical protein
MTQEFQPTPAEQNLLNFLDKLATTPYSPELMQEGNQLLDAAVEENRRLLTPSTLFQGDDHYQAGSRVGKGDGVMSDKQHYLNLFASMQIPENLASQAADALARQDAGELPCP